MLFRFAIEPEQMRRRFGVPHYGPNGPRGLPAWGFELEDGTTFELHHREKDDTCYVNGDLRDVGYLMARLEIDEAFDRLDADADHYAMALDEHFPAWRMHRVVSGDDVYETPSPREAAWRAALTGGRVEIEAEADARARHDRIVDERARRPKRPPPLRAVSSDGTWELWRVAGDGGRSLIGVFEDRQRAEAAKDAAQGEVELVPRG